MGREQTIETRIKISKSLGGNGILKNLDRKCKYCGKETKNKKYCCHQCSVLARIPKEYERKNLKSRKEILWNEQGSKCNKCGYSFYGWENGPYEIHHIDGNRNNMKRENEELICCNCHFMTNNYRFKGRRHTEESKQLISQNWNPPSV